MYKNYKSQYLDPRWQKKRLEIMERDNFRCTICGSEEKTLHVHHLYYEKNKKVWDYKNYALITHCEDCHKWVHKNDIEYDGLDAKELCKIIGSIVNTYMSNEEEMNKYLASASLVYYLGSLANIDKHFTEDDGEEFYLEFIYFFKMCIRQYLKHDEMEDYAKLCGLYGYVWNYEYMKYRFALDTKQFEEKNK